MIYLYDLSIYLCLYVVLVMLLILQKIPANYSWLGIRNEALGSVHPLHSPHFQVSSC